MLSAKEFIQLQHFQNDAAEREPVDKIKEFMKTQFDADLYKCVFKYDEFYRVCSVFIYFHKNQQLKKVESLMDDETVNMKTKHILEECEIPHNQSVWTFLRSFELEALIDCYRAALQKYPLFKAERLEKERLKIICPPAMFVQYATKELYDAAKESGEMERFIEEYYQFIKPYDVFDLVTREKHLPVRFDYAEGVKSSRYYFDIYWKILEE